MAANEYVQWPGPATFPGDSLYPFYVGVATGSTVVHAPNTAAWTEITDEETKHILTFANTQANAAMQQVRSAGGRVTYFTGDGYPPLLGEGIGDTARGRDAVTGEILVEYVWTGSTWDQQQVSSGLVSNLDVGKLTAGSAAIDSAVVGRIAADTAQVMQLDVSHLTASDASMNELTSRKVWAGIVTSRAIQANKITGDQIAAGAITADNGVIGSLDAGVITSGSLDSARIAAGSITAAQLAAGTIKADSAAVASLDASKITVGSMDAARIAAGTITGDKIAAGAITAGSLSAGAINGQTITGGTLIAGSEASQAVATVGPVGSGTFGIDVTSANSGSGEFAVKSTGPYVQFRDNSNAETFFVDGAGNFRMKDRVRGGTVSLDKYLSSWTYNTSLGNWAFPAKTTFGDWGFMGPVQNTVSSPTGKFKIEHRLLYDDDTLGADIHIQVGLYTVLNPPSSTSNLYGGVAWAEFHALTGVNVPSYTASEVVSVPANTTFYMRSIMWYQAAQGGTLTNSRYWAQCTPV